MLVHLREFPLIGYHMGLIDFGRDYQSPGRLELWASEGTAFQLGALLTDSTPVTNILDNGLVTEMLFLLGLLFCLEYLHMQ